MSLARARTQTAPSIHMCYFYYLKIQIFYVLYSSEHVWYKALLVITNNQYCFISFLRCDKTRD